MKLAIALLGLAQGKGPCEDYFGDVSGAVTVIDPDVGLTDASGPYCDGAGHARPCTFIHYAGLGTECISPGPPDGCHRYIKTTYDKTNLKCMSALKKLNITGSVDVDDVFTTDGVYTQGGCSDAAVVSREVHCYGPPASEPQQCECPSLEAVV